MGHFVKILMGPVYYVPSPERLNGIGVSNGFSRNWAGHFVKIWVGPDFGLFHENLDGTSHENINWASILPVSREIEWDIWGKLSIGPVYWPVSQETKRDIWGKLSMGPVYRPVSRETEWDIWGKLSMGPVYRPVSRETEWDIL